MSESSSWLLSGADGQLTGSAFGIPVSASRRLYRCADDRWVSVAADEPRTWTALCRGLDLPDLAASRPADEAEAARRIGDALRTRPASEWISELGPLGTTVTAVHEGSSLLDDPHVRARQAVVDVGGTPTPANPIRIRGPQGKRTTTVNSSPPDTGAHTDEVLTAAGYTAVEIDDLRSSGAIG
jgi:crotonobetainyl-CoA:carnitine CoA-transferase CaiB-like acyl-CoA transferase